MKSLETMLSGRSGELLITVARLADQTTSSTQTTNQDSDQSVPLTNDSMGHKSQPLQNGNKPSTNLVSKNGWNQSHFYLSCCVDKIQPSSSTTLATLDLNNLKSSYIFMMLQYFLHAYTFMYRSVYKFLIFF